MMDRKTLISFIDDCERRGDETALARRAGLRTDRWSYRDLRFRSYQFARELESRGVSHGDRVLFWADNSPEWVCAFFGCLLRGAVAVPLDQHTSAEFVSRVQNQVEARLMLVSAGRRTDTAVSSLSLDGLVAILDRHPSSPVDAGVVHAGDLVQIIYTSGTTAEPKGVCITHGNLLANLVPLEHEIDKYRWLEKPFHPVRFLVLLPLSHVFGQFMGIYVPQLLGGGVYFLDSMNPREIIRTVKQNRISVIVGVPRQLATLRDAIERDYAARGELDVFKERLERAEAMHFLRRWWVFREVHRKFGWKFLAFVSGGATLDARIDAFWRRLGYAVVQGYGMTETASLISVNHPFKSSKGSIGKVMPGQEVKLAENGEILVRGPNVSPGYWRKGMEPVAGENGWLRTGDIAERDEEGNLFFRGRKKDVIVTAAGLNIYPEDLEAALNRQPEVRESAVIGVEGPHGPEPLAVLLLDKPDADPAEVVKSANRELALPQHMRQWHVWPEDDFPRTPASQKPLKRLIAEAITAHPAEAKGIAARGTLAEAISAAKGVVPEQLKSSDELSADLKLDSLGRVELMSEIEHRYNVDLDEAAFSSATTVSDIERLISAPRATRSATRNTKPYPYPKWAQRFPATWVRALVYYILILPISRLMCWVRVEGKDHLRGVRGPVLLISNHVSAVDPGLILSALPPRFRRRLAIAMEGERLRSFRHPTGGGWFTRLRLRIQYVLVVTLFNVFSLPQTGGVRTSFAFLGETMERGYNVLVFPEGRLTRDGALEPFMRGIGLLATSLAVPVVPMRIDGLFELREKRQYFVRPGRVSITFGAPVAFSREADPGDVVKELEKRVAAL